MKLLERKDVPVELTWDLSRVYPSEAEFDSDKERMRALCDELTGYQGKLNDSDNIIACLKKYEEYLIITDDKEQNCYSQT